jgi:hypothetical protein
MGMRSVRNDSIDCLGLGRTNACKLLLVDLCIDGENSFKFPSLIAIGDVTVLPPNPAVS